MDMRIKTIDAQSDKVNFLGHIALDRKSIHLPRPQSRSDDNSYLRILQSIEVITIEVQLEYE